MNNSFIPKHLDNGMFIEKIDNLKGEKIFKILFKLWIIRRYDSEFWISQSLNAKKNEMMRVKEYLKQCVIELVGREIENKGSVWINIAGKPLKHICIGDCKHLVILENKQLIYLKMFSEIPPYIWRRLLRGLNEAER